MDNSLENVLRFWRAVEASTPQRVERINASHCTQPVYGLSQNSTAFPWIDPLHTGKSIAQDRTWRYVFQCGLYRTDELSKKLKDKIGAHQEVFDEERSVSLSRLFDLGVDEHGFPIAQTFVLSLACWSAGQILRTKDGIVRLEQGGYADTADLPLPDQTIDDPRSGYSGFDELSRRLMQRILNDEREMRRSKCPMTKEWLDLFVDQVALKCFLPNELLKHECIIKAFQVRKPIENPEDSDPGKKDSTQNTHPSRSRKKNSAPISDKQNDADNSVKSTSTDDLLNSFFISDLKELIVAWNRHDVGKGFREYMTSVTRSKTYPRLDLRSKAGIEFAFQALSPEHMPRGAWPSLHPLAFSQQLAVNEVWRSLLNEPGLFAVNGPPGTGKTTLLRDIVAAVVTERAMRMVQIKGKAFGKKESTKLSNDWASYYEFAEAISDTAIVVTSSNNGAVENISLELPGIGAVPEYVSEREGGGYFSILANRVLGKSCWGMLAARLGSKANRSEFLNKFWWAEPLKTKNAQQQNPSPIAFAAGEGLRYHLRHIQEGKRKPIISWKEATQRFKTCLAEEDSIRQLLVDDAKNPKRVVELTHRIEEINHNIDQSNQDLKRKQETIKLIAEQGKKESKVHARLSETFNQTQILLREHHAAKPGLLVWISTLGRSHSEWWKEHRILQRNQHDLHEKIQLAVSRLHDLKSTYRQHVKTILS